MAIVSIGLFSLNIYAILGSFVLMIAHAFSSSGLFIVVTSLYNRHGSRLIKYFRGMSRQMPVLALIFLMLTLANISFPGSMNFIGEILIFLGFFRNFKGMTILITISVVLSATYSLYLYNRIAFGLESIYLIQLNRDLSRSEFFTLLPILISCYFLGLNTNFFNLLEIPILKVLFLYA